MDREPAAQRIKAVRKAGKARLGKRQCVNHTGGVQTWAAEQRELSVEKAEIERRVMRDQLILGQKLYELVDDIGKARLAPQILKREAVNPGIEN